MPLPNPRAYTAEDYWSTPEGERCELIDGELVAMAPPSRTHQRLVLQISRQLSDYIDAHGGTCEVCIAPFAVNLDGRNKNWVEPDVSVVCDPDKLTERGCNGAPDLVVEVVSPSTQGHDYIRKAGLYEAAGVREYWIVDPAYRQVLVYRYASRGASPTMYSFEDAVPVEIYEGGLSIVVGSLL